MLTETEKGLLEKIADMKEGEAEGAVNVRIDEMCIRDKTWRSAVCATTWTGCWTPPATRFAG